MLRFSTTLCLTVLSVATICAQADAPPADFLRSIGKIYVVVAVIVVVFLGLAFYLWSLDRKLTDLENQIDDHA